MTLAKSGRTAGAGPIGPPPAPTLDMVLADLASEDVRLRRQAARNLAGHPEAADALCQRLAIEPAASVRTMLLTTLIRLHSPAVAAGLAAFLHSEDAGLRNAVIEALQEMPGETGALMDRLLADPDSDIRILAVNILGGLCHDAVPDWLIRVIDHDPHVNVCAAAVDCLAEAGTVAALPHLDALGRRFADQPFLHFAISVAIRRIKGE